MDQYQSAGAPPTAAPNLKWSYMDHWSVLTPRGFVAPQLGPRTSTVSTRRWWGWASKV